MRGYFEIGVYYPKAEVNVGTLWRSAMQLGASGIFTIGRRYHRQSSDTVNACRHLPMRHFLTFEEFAQSRPYGAVLIGVEMGGRLLGRFCHPERAVYLLGAEDFGLPPAIRRACQYIVSLEAVRMPVYNVAVAGSIVMYHRRLSNGGFA